MTTTAAKASGQKKRTTRLRIFIWALIVCTFMAAIELPLPLDGAYRGIRNEVRARPADQSIVVVALDSKTIKAFGTDYFSREHYARLLDQAFAEGAKRVYFDEAFSKEVDPDGDKAFAEALSRYKGKTFSGAFTFRNRSTGEVEEVGPIPLFSDRTTVRSLNGAATPFSLSAELVKSDTFGGKVINSVSGDIAGKTGPVAVRYMPDWSIQVKSIPTVSFVDFVEGKVDPSLIRGKDLLVGTTAEPTDFVQIYGQGWFGGVYAHAVGAQTLKEGNPIKLGWMPAMLVATILSAAVLFGRTRAFRTVVVIVAALLALGLPFVLDQLFITVDYVSAMIMFVVVTLRAAMLREMSDARLKNAGSMLPNLAALREEPSAAGKPIVAMRIRNYAAVCSSFDTPVEDELFGELARRLSVPNNLTRFYQAEDVLYWLAPSGSTGELRDHLAGLARLIESHFEIRGRKLDLQVVFGVDIELNRPVANRIGRALMAADNAATKHQLMQFNTNTSDEDAAWELSLMSELDAAITAGDIWIAYQPQFDLRSDKICGAEALVRWQHPTRGAISPEAFVLPAEAHNRIERLTFHILEKATQAAKPLLAANPGFRLGINISASILEHPQLPAKIAQILIMTGYPASNLTLEVTESAPFNDRDVVAANLAGIAAIGIDLSIDDYGTGNATLEYLRSVPCQEIKIDRRFVAGLSSNASDLLLVESTVDLAHGLGRRVIAEGIEDPETLEMLRRIGCDIAQGYYLAKPLRFEALQALLANSASIQAA